MREYKKRIVFIGLVFLVIVILAAVPIIWPRLRPMKAVYLEDENGHSIFVELEDDLPFTGPIPQNKLYDENGKKISEKDLNNGDVVNIYGDGGMLDSHPAQYPGITKIEITEQINQEYIEKYGHILRDLKRL